jgi:hypothetical protein
LGGWRPNPHALPFRKKITNDPETFAGELVESNNFQEEARNQARIDFDKAGLVELAESIKATGLLQQEYEEQENLKIMKIKTGAKKDKAKF